MALIGVSLLGIVAMVVFVRSDRPVNMIFVTLSFLIGVAYQVVVHFA